MGTYIYYEQIDENQIEKTKMFLEEAVHPDTKKPVLSIWNADNEKAAAENGNDGLSKIGCGQIKISGDSYLDELYRPAQALKKLSLAKVFYGLEVRLPPNADDYLTDEEIALFMPTKELRKIQEAEEKAYQESRKAREIALKKARDEFNGGLYLCESWGVSKFWVMFGQVDPPAFMKFHWQVGDQEYSELFRDEEGRAVLLIPLRRLTGNRTGEMEVRKALDYAWDNLGLRTDPDVLLVACYKYLPKEIVIEGIRYTVSQPKNPIYLFNNTALTFVENGKIVTKKQENQVYDRAQIALRSKRKKKGTKSLSVVNHYELGRIYEISLKRIE